VQAVVLLSRRVDSLLMLLLHIINNVNVR